MMHSILSIKTRRNPKSLVFVLVLWLFAAQGYGDVLVKRPSDPDGGPTTVFVSIFLLDIDEISSANQTFTANIAFDLRWSDPRLSHSEDGDRVISIDDIWMPRVQIANQQRLVKTFPEIAYVAQNGEVSYQQRIWGNFSQALNLRDFPFDSQEFRIDMVSAGYAPDELVLVQDPKRASGIADELSLPDWGITGIIAEGMVHQPNATAGALSGFQFKFAAQRQVGYYIWKVVFPLVLIVAMSWIVFWIDPKESGTQISVSITSMLTLIAYRFMVGGLLPTISYLTRLDRFILFSTILVFATLILVVVTSTLAKSDNLENARRVDRFARVGFPVAFFLMATSAFLF